MADATKHLPISGGTLISDLKSLFSLLRTRRTIAFAYGFMFAFIAFTVFLAFNPSSNSSSPWFTNIFSSGSSSTSSSTTTTTTFSDHSYRSHFSSIFSYFFPNSPPQLHNSTSLPSQTNTSTSQNTTFQLANSNKQPSIHNSTSLASQTNTSTSQNTTFQLANSNKQPSIHNSTSLPSLTNTSTSQNTTFQLPNSNKQPPIPKNQPQSNVPHVKGEVFKPNQTSIAAEKANRTSNSPSKSTSEGKKSSGNEEKRIGEKGVVSNLTVSLSKKPSNGSGSGVSEKQGKESLIESLVNCNLFDGEWVRDDSYPLYKPGSCSLIDEQFNCFLNGRPDRDYEKLKWKPKGCTLPRLNGSHMLELLKGKRLVFVGDSLNRNMWESLVCILRNSVKDQSKVFEASGRHHFRTEASYSFIFKDYNCSIEFFVSPFLVQEWEMPDKNGSKKETLRLDRIGRSSDKYKSADFLVFNTGHWWTHDKTSKGKDYYQEGNRVYDELNVIEAFRKALTTWARWVDVNVNSKKTLVFFRGYSASHFSGGQWNSGGQCDSETEPIKNKTYLSQYPPKMTVLESVLKGMKTHVSYLNITRITDYRKDAHPSVYRKQHLSVEERKSPLRYQDCSHWCLPGVPDTWNELLYAELLIRQNQKRP